MFKVWTLGPIRAKTLPLRVPHALGGRPLTPAFCSAAPPLAADANAPTPGVPPPLAVRHRLPTVCVKENENKKQRSTTIATDCICQSFPAVTAAKCHGCVSPPAPSACVARRLSDVGLIRCIGCVPHARERAHTHTDRDTERREIRQGALFILCRL